MHAKILTAVFVLAFSCLSQAAVPQAEVMMQYNEPIGQLFDAPPNSMIHLAGKTFQTQQSGVEVSGNRWWTGVLGNDYQANIAQDINGQIAGSILTLEGERIVVSGTTEAPVFTHLKGFDRMPEHGAGSEPKSVPKQSAERDMAVSGLVIPPAITQAWRAPATAKAAVSSASIDVMVIYTTDVPNPSAAISNLNAAANAAHAASGTGVQLNVVYTGSVNYPSASDNGSALDALTNQQGVFAGIEQLRTQVGADVVILARPFNQATQGGCGVAWLNPPSNYGYGVISIGANNGFFCEDLTYAHEIGHLMGAAHDRANSSSQGAFPYSYGYGISGRFGTIMSYISPRVGKFSSPNLLCGPLNEPCGVSATSANSADNVRTFQQTAAGVAAWRSPSTVSCNPSLSNNSTTATAGGGNASVQLTLNAACTWSASSSVAWIGVTPGNGSGSAQLTLNIQPNTSTSSRQGSVTIAGLSYTVAQASSAAASPAACNLTANNTQTYTNETILFQNTCTGITPSSHTWISNGAQLSVTTGNTLNVTFQNPGTYNVQAGATDGTRNVYSNIVTITIVSRPAVNPASCNISFNKTNPQVGETVNGSVACTGFSPFAYYWRINGNIDNSTNAASYSHVFTGAGSYEMQVMASDGLTAVLSNTIQLLVSNAAIPVPTNGKCVLQSSKTTLLAGDNASATINCTDIFPSRYEWRIDGSPFAVFDNTGLTSIVSSILAGPGTYYMQVEVTHSAGKLLSNIVLFNVSQPGLTAEAGCYLRVSQSHIMTGEPLKLNTVCTGVQASLYEWYSSNALYTTSTVPNTTVAFSTFGTYTIYGRVTTNKGIIVTKPATVVVTNGAVEAEVLEYVLPTKEHYFLTAEPGEKVFLDAKGAGPWTTTGSAIKLWKGSALLNGQNNFGVVYRFYNNFAVTHFFTSSKDEYDLLVSLNPTNDMAVGWVLESNNAFLAKTPDANRQCETGTTPVWRLYNNRFRENDSNHRFVTNPQDYNLMQSKGWLPEGVVFCARP